METSASSPRIKQTATRKKPAAKPPKSRRPSYLGFDKAAYAWQPDIDYRRHPEYYKIGKGEQGVLICEPYKSELTPHWQFKTPDVAQTSAETLYAMFLDYLKRDEFVGADMARKFLQMGFTRARRYANYKGGRKYDKADDYKPLDKGTGDPVKAQSAQIFYDMWQRAEEQPDYKKRKAEWKMKIG